MRCFRPLRRGPLSVAWIDGASRETRLRSAPRLRPAAPAPASHPRLCGRRSSLRGRPRNGSKMTSPARCPRMARSIATTLSGTVIAWIASLASRHPSKRMTRRTSAPALSSRGRMVSALPSSQAIVITSAHGTASVSPGIGRPVVRRDAMSRAIMDFCMPGFPSRNAIFPNGMRPCHGQVNVLPLHVSHAGEDRAMRSERGIRLARVALPHARTRG